MKAKGVCSDCYQPPKKRLALFAPQGEFQCYADGYVKCFWGLCDLHKSHEELVRKQDDKVITEEPKAQILPYKNPITKEFIMFEVNPRTK